MKNLFIILTLVILTMAMTTHAENDEWGAWFKESMEKSKRHPIEPEDKKLNMSKWKNNKAELINNYKKYLERDDNSDKNKTTDTTLRSEIISSYYFDNTDTDIDKIVKFFIYVANFEKEEGLKIKAINQLTTLSLEGISLAKDYITSQLNNSSLSHRFKLQFHLANLTIKDDRKSKEYLMKLVKKTQEIKTTNIKFNSSDESIILWYLLRNYFGQRYLKNLDYEYALPLMKQMLFSRSKNVQSLTSMEYLSLTNKSEIEKIYDDCWAKVKDKKTPKEEYLNALYGLQALYFLEKKSLKKYKIEFKGIGGYFSKLGTYILTEGGKKFAGSKSEFRINEKQKEYFIQRLDH